MFEEYGAVRTKISMVEQAVRKNEHQTEKYNLISKHRYDDLECRLNALCNYLGVEIIKSSGYKVQKKAKQSSTETQGEDL